MWNAWLGYKYNIEEEVIINPVQNKGIHEYLNLLEKSIVEASRVLKQWKRFTLCFNNKEFKVWKGVLDIFKRNGFCLEHIDIIDTLGNSYNTNWAKFSLKVDLYLTFVKKKFKATHCKVFSVEDVLNNITLDREETNPSDAYSLLAVTFIQELYYNEFQIDIHDLTIKKVGRMIKRSDESNGI